MDDLNWRDVFIKAISNVTRNSEHKLFVRYSRTNKRKNTFSIRVVPVWNGLCQTTKSADTVNICCNRLDKDPSINAFRYELDEYMSVTRAERKKANQGLLHEREIIAYFAFRAQIDYRISSIETDASFARAQQ